MVNVKNFNIEAKDRSIKLLFEVQKKYNKLFKVERIDIDTHAGQEQVKKFIYYVIEELMEASNLLKNRPWTKHETIVDKDHFQEELIDAFDFMIAVLDAAGIDDKKLVKLFLAKYNVNKFRHETKY
jgi:hypothetical protein